MQVVEIEPGLWRWTAPHPAWLPEKGGPGGWDRMVGCIYHEPAVASRDAIVLIDPLAPPVGTDDAERFWRALDRDVTRLGLPVRVLVSNARHGRDAVAVRSRYAEVPGCEILVPEAAAPALDRRADGTFRDGDRPAAGVRALAVNGLDEGETAFWLAPRRTLVFANAVIGAGGGRLRVAPPSWAASDEQGRSRYAAGFRRSLRRLAALNPRRVLVAHGEPALEEGRRALEEALDAPAWGEAGIDPAGEERVETRRRGIP